MSFERVHQSRSQTPQTSSHTSQFAPRPFPVQEPKRPLTQDDIENEAFQQNKFEAFGLQLKEQHGTITPVEQERLGMLQAKMDSFWAQRMERAKAQPNLLEILIRNAQASPTPEPATPVQPKLAIGEPNDQYEQEADQVAEQVMKMPAPPEDSQPQPSQNSVQRKPVTPATQQPPGFAHLDLFSHAPQRRPLINPLQAKLTIGQPNDIYEQEADRVAEQVMRMAPPTPPNLQRQPENEKSEEMQPKSLVEMITPIVQRQEEATDEDLLQPKCETCEQEEQVQRSADGMIQAQPDLESRLNASKGGGSPLLDEVRSFMEPRFGADFSQVRVHTDSNAIQMNKDLNAQAFTHKQDVYFGAGKTPGKDALTAHELTHVVQQSGKVQAEVVQRDVNPEIANLPATLYVDTYHEIRYSLDYRAQGGNLSTWLQVHYSDGTLIDISIDDILDRTVDPRTHIQMMENGHVGEGGRIFPQEMNSTTTPRLASAKRSAIETMEEYNYEFIMATIPAILFIITMPLGISRPTRPTRTTTRLSRVRTRTPSPPVPFSPSQIADELHTATQSLGNPGRMMLEAARRLTTMRHLSAAQKVEVMLEFFRRIGFAIRGTVQETSEYFLMFSENGQYAFKFIKETGQIIYGRFDMAARDFIWSTL